MSINEKAIKREESEPFEENKAIPSIFLVFIGLIGGWGSSYFYYNAANSHGRGDTRSLVVQKAPGEQSPVIDGAQVYASRCSACHQSTGEGLPGAFPPLKDSEWVQDKPHVAANILLRGLQGEVTVRNQAYNGIMPNFRDNLSDEELAAVLGHVRTQFGGVEKDVTPETFAKLRKEMAEGAIQGQAELEHISKGTTFAPKAEQASEAPKEEPMDEPETTVSNGPAQEVTTEEKQEATAAGGFSIDNGKQVYTRICAACHMAEGTGIPQLYPPLKGSEWVNREPEIIATVVSRGLAGEISVAGNTFQSAMPPFAASLSDQELVDVISYVQKDFGGIEPSIDSASIAAIKAKGGAILGGGTELGTLFPQ